MSYREQYDLNRKARRALKTARKIQKKLKSGKCYSDECKHKWKHLLAKSMRLNPTKHEAILYDALTKEGITFEPQAVVGPYIVDVLIPYKKVVEVDGCVHDKQKEYDEARSQFLWRRGYRIVRFRNKQITQSLDEVIHEIKELMNTPL